MDETQPELTETTPEPGVWAVIVRDHYESIDRFFATEIDALRYAVENGGRVAFLKFGEGLTDG